MGPKIAENAGIFGKLNECSTGLSVIVSILSAILNWLLALDLRRECGAAESVFTLLTCIVPNCWDEHRF